MVIDNTVGPLKTNFSSMCSLFHRGQWPNLAAQIGVSTSSRNCNTLSHCQITVYPKKYAHGFVVLCFVVVMQSFIMNSHEVFIHIHQGCFAGTGAIVRLPQCQWSKPDGYGKISQCITTQSTAKQKPCAYFLGYTVAHEIATRWANVKSSSMGCYGIHLRKILHELYLCWEIKRLYSSRYLPGGANESSIEEWNPIIPLHVLTK